MIHVFQYSLCIVLALGASTTQAAITFSVANLGTFQQGSAQLGSFDVDVTVTRDGADANAQIIGATIGFAVAAGDGTSGALVADPPGTFTGPWTSTVWAQNNHALFSATGSGADSVDQATTNVLNGFQTVGFSAVDASGLLARYNVNFSGLAPGTYAVTADLAGASRVNLANTTTFDVSSSAGSITITAVPEPSVLVLLPVLAGCCLRMRQRDL